jgi:hypothetical protein
MKSYSANKPQKGKPSYGNSNNNKFIYQKQMKMVKGKGSHKLQKMY